MQWWMRPGPRRACAIAKPPPSSPSRFDDGHPDVVVDDLAVAVLVLPAEHRRRAHHRHPGGVDRHQDHRLLLMGGGVGVGAAHHDEDLAARVGRAGRPPLAAVDDVVVAVAQHRGLDVAGVAGWPPPARSSRTRCGSRRPAAAPATACAAASVANRCRVSMLPVSGAAQLSASGASLHAPAGQLGQRRVLEVGQPRHRGQEQVPQPAVPGELLEFLDDRRHGVVVRARLAAGSGRSTASAGKTNSVMKAVSRSW